MKLLEAEPSAAPAGAPGDRPTGESPSAAPARTCAACGADLAPGQDWCLSCGTARGALDDRPGRRPVLTIAGMLIALLTGAVGAGFAALSDDPAPAPTAAPGPVAQVPQPAQPAPTAPETTPTTPGASTGEGKLPKVKAPSSGSPERTPSPRSLSPARSAPQSDPPAPTPAPSTDATDTPSGSGTTAPRSAGASASARPAPPEELELAGDAASVYDPYGRSQATGVTGRALDGEAGTSWYADVAPGSPQINLGYAVRLGESRGIRAVEITTPTPGFRVEVYASDEATPPPTITDTRWAHITDRSNVGRDDDRTRIVLGAGSSKYQTLLLWITQPPQTGTRVRISELKVFG